MLRVDHLHAGYGPVTIVRDVSFAVAAGEIVGVVAPNGTGKSTLFKAICGLCDTHAGTVRWSPDPSGPAQDILRYPVAKRVRLGIRYVPERSDVFAELTVYDNLRIAMEAIGESWSEAAFESGIGSLFPLLVERRRAAAQTLSGGQRRMLSLAMALVQRPRLLLVDEPFAGLAPAVVGTLAAVLRGIKDTGVALAVIDHNLGAMLALSDRIVLLRLGAVVFDRPRGEVTEADILAAFT